MAKGPEPPGEESSLLLIIAEYIWQTVGKKHLYMQFFTYFLYLMATTLYALYCTTLGEWPKLHETKDYVSMGTEIFLGMWTVVMTVRYIRFILKHIKTNGTMPMTEYIFVALRMSFCTLLLVTCVLRVYLRLEKASDEDLQKGFKEMWIL